MNPWRASAAALVAALALAVPVHAHAGEQAHLERVLLLPVPGRVTIVLEMSAAPGSVTSRRVSGDLLEVDAGPARVDRAQAYTAPAGSSLVSTVLIDRLRADDSPATLRARITLRETCRSAVRVQGHRVYIDISSPDASPMEASAPAAGARVAARTRNAAPPAPASEGDDRAAEAAVDAALNRFGELLPFITSAAAAPSGPVLAALAAPLVELDRSVRALPAATALRPAEGLLGTAMSAASKAMDPGYLGDRVEEARQAEIFFEEAKRERVAAETTPPRGTGRPSSRTEGPPPER